MARNVTRKTVARRNRKTLLIITTALGQLQVLLLEMKV